MSCRIFIFVPFNLSTMLFKSQIVIKTTMKVSNQKRNPLGSPPLPNQVKKYKSETSLEKKTPRTIISNQYCLQKQKLIGKNDKISMKDIYENQQNDLPLTSEIKLNKQSSDSYYPTVESELEKKRVSFGEDRYCFVKNRLNRQSRDVPQRRTSILKSSSQISRSNSILSMNSSVEKNLNARGRVLETEPTLNKYKNIQADFESKKKESKEMIYRGQKYTDTLFPPVSNSLFTSKHLREGQRSSNEIAWKRIPQIFKGKKLRLKKEAGQDSCTFINPGKYGSPMFCQALEAIKHVDDLLTWIFGQTSFNVFGVYCLRICQNNTVKYIIIDDFIPVVQDSNSEWVPAFTNVESFNPNKYSSKALQIWPLLLQKAYASYYCSYESLRTGNLVDFIEQISGNHFVQVIFPDLQKKALTKNFIILQKNPQQSYNQTLMASLLKKKGKIQTQLKLMDYCPPNQLISKILPGKETQKEQKPSFYLKKITVKGKMGQGSIGVRQKDQKFYHHTSGGYQYVWVRAVLLRVDYDGSYHWIDGSYAQTKSINFDLPFLEGDYYLLVMPEWKLVQRHEISVIVNSRSTEGPASELVSIFCLPYLQKEHMFEKGCADLAQLKGKLKQLNKVICSYNYVCTKSGMVVESVHNERISGEVAIERQWKSASKLLLPFNEEFQGGGKKRVEIVIPRDGSFTWVFLCQGGLHLEELQKFDFK